MRLIGLAVVLALSLFVTPKAVEAQPPTKPVIGLLHRGAARPIAIAHQIRAGDQTRSSLSEA